MRAGWVNRKRKLQIAVLAKKRQHRSNSQGTRWEVFDCVRLREREKRRLGAWGVSLKEREGTRWHDSRMVGVIQKQRLFLLLHTNARIEAKFRCEPASKVKVRYAVGLRQVKCVHGPQSNNNFNFHSEERQFRPPSRYVDWGVCGVEFVK